MRLFRRWKKSDVSMPTGYEVEQEEIKEAYRAIGHYVVAFSWLVAAMRNGIEWQLGEQHLAMLALGELTAAQIANSFFAISEEIADLDDEEIRVARRLKAEVLDTIKQRNDFAHGDWGFEFEAMHLWRIKPGRKAGAMRETIHKTGDIEALTTRMDELRKHIYEFRDLCANTHPSLTGAANRSEFETSSNSRTTALCERASTPRTGSPRVPPCAPGRPMPPTGPWSTANQGRDLHLPPIAW